MRATPSRTTTGRRTGRAAGLPRRALLPAVSALLAVGVLAGCSGTDPDAGPEPTGEATAPTDVSTPAQTDIVADAADDDACALLPEADLAQVLGEDAVPQAIPSGGWIAGQCSWSGPTTGFLLSIGTEESITAFQDPAEADAEAKLAAFSGRQADAAQEIPDLGDGAVAGPSGVAARVGGTYLELELLSLSQEQALGVMRLAVDNLGS